MKVLLYRLAFDLIVWPKGEVVTFSDRHNGLYLKICVYRRNANTYHTELRILYKL